MSAADPGVDVDWSSQRAWGGRAEIRPAANLTMMDQSISRG